MDVGEDFLSDCLVTRARNMWVTGKQVGVVFFGTDEEVIEGCVEQLRSSYPGRYGYSQ